jgi:2-oxoglutarate ferredoxin oxidoreductase subunit gamma
MAVTNGLYEEIIIAGFGGQGIILVGKLLAQTAMKADLEVTYMPSYGAEVRGGTANCTVIVADKAIACPLASEPESLIALNKASLHKFGSRIKPGGLLLWNSCLIDDEPEPRDNIDMVAIPADEVAVELGSPKSANMVMLGAYLKKRGHLSLEQASEALRDVLAERYHKTIPANIEALRRGAELAVCPA